MFLDVLWLYLFQNLIYNVYQAGIHIIQASQLVFDDDVYIIYIKKKVSVKMDRFQKFPQLESQRLILREMTLGNLDFYFRYFNDYKNS